MGLRSRSRSPRVQRGQTDRGMGLRSRSRSPRVQRGQTDRGNGFMCMSGRRVLDGEDDFTSVPFAYPSHCQSPPGAASEEQCLDEFFPICVNEIPRGREGIGYNRMMPPGNSWEERLGFVRESTDARDADDARHYCGTAATVHIERNCSNSPRPNSSMSVSPATNGRTVSRSPIRGGRSASPDAHGGEQTPAPRENRRSVSPSPEQDMDKDGHSHA
ncbi:hypothetical protein KC19_7G062100 [Ceratodon purpureus]|nr:hypothetical protein KC19_7G062100 [Ceratodon purpureus]